MAKLFTRLSKEIHIAVKAGGPDPHLNPALRRVLQNARAGNMPKDKIDSAIKRASGQDQNDYAEVLYEGYGPHGVAVIVETATDNITRTVANVRLAFKSNGGNLGTTGSVSFVFKRMGTFRIAADGVDQESLELDLIDHGLEEMGESENEKGEKQLVLRCAFHDFGRMQSAIEERKLSVVSSQLEQIPQTLAELSEEQAKEVFELVDTLEQDDDVTHVFHNMK